MLDDNYLFKLKIAQTPLEVELLMKNRVFPLSDNTKFLDKEFRLKNPSGNFSLSTHSFDDFYEIVFNILLYLKFDGKMGFTPMHSGASAYYSDLSILLRYFQDKFPRLSNAQELSSSDIDQYILEHSHLSTNTVDSRLRKLKEWISFSNEFLPYFMQINDEVLINSYQYKKLMDQVRQNSANRLLKDSSKVYPLEYFKILLGKSFVYIEEYSEEIILLLRFLNSIKVFNQWKKEVEIFKYFKNHRSFKEPTLEEIRLNIYNSSSTIDKNRNFIVKQVMRELNHIIEYLEASCIVTILFLTSMRSSELIRLQRYPKITEGEYYNLYKIVYKTSNDEEGDVKPIPIPLVAKKAIDLLSIMATIKDNDQYDKIITFSLLGRNEEIKTSNKLNYLVKKFSSKINLPFYPTPHQFRHAMAFLISFINEKDGLDLARMFLSHESIIMTLRYMGQYNALIKEPLNILTKEVSKASLKSIINEVENGRALFGYQGEKIMKNHYFTGSYKEGYADILNKGFKELISNSKISIIQTPVCFCIHDLTKREKMDCQRGLNKDDLMGELPVPSNCNGANCNNSLFTESIISQLKYEEIDKEMASRLLDNSIFFDSGGFNKNPLNKIIDQYNSSKHNKDRYGTNN